MLWGWDREMFWTTLSYQLSTIHLNICPRSAWVPTGWQAPSNPFLAGCSPTVPQEAEPRQAGPGQGQDPGVVMCWQLAEEAVVIRQVPGSDTRNRYSPKVTQDRTKGAHQVAVCPLLTGLSQMSLFSDLKPHSCTKHWP